MTEWIIKLHPDFLKDLDRLDKKHLEIFHKKIEKNIIWFLTIGVHDEAYKEYIKRLYSLRQKFLNS